MFGDNFSTACEPCYNTFLPQFPEDDLVLIADLAAATTYWWIIEDSKGIRWAEQATTDGNGDLTIPIASFPAGLFAAGAGRFLLYILTDLEDPETVELTLGNSYLETQYQCVSIVFYATDSDTLTTTTIE